MVIPSVSPLRIPHENLELSTVRMKYIELMQLIIKFGSYLSVCRTAWELHLFAIIFSLVQASFVESSNTMTHLPSLNRTPPPLHTLHVRSRNGWALRPSGPGQASGLLIKGTELWSN